MPYQEFLQYLKNQKRVSPHTQISYANDLNGFFYFVKTEFETNKANEISSAMVRTWIATLMEQGLESTSVNRKLSAIRSFYNFLLKTNQLNENPFKKINGPKAKKRLPVFVDENRMEKLFIQQNNNGEFKDVLGTAILELFYATGIRLSELINLKLVNYNNGTIKVLGKRNKERIVPLTEAAINALEQYLTLRQTILTIVDKDHFFIDEKGKKLYQKFVYRLIKHYLGQVTTDKKRSPHVLRHTFATHLLNNGAELNAVKEMLGHSSLAATQIYTHNTINKLINIHQKAHPFERKAI